MCHSVGGANALQQNPYLQCGGDSAALSVAIAISISQGDAPGQAQAQAESGKAGKHGKLGKNGKNGKNGKHGKNGKNGKEQNGLQSPLHNNASMAIAMALAASANQGQGCSPCNPMGSPFAMAGAGSMGMCSPMGGMQGANQQNMLMGLMCGLMLANQMNNASMGANPGMGGFLNQFGRCGF